MKPAALLLILLSAIPVLAQTPKPNDAPVFPYGAVYFRKSNPPEQDWAKDHATAARVGMNTFRHWFMWEAVEVAPGKYDWSDYDRMMDLAAKNGIKVVIAELVTSAPEWVYEKYPHARFKASDGSTVQSTNSVSTGTGGFPGMCLDNDDVRALAEKFLVALVERYRNHPATLGFDLWNENTYDGGSPQKMYCYCDATQRKYRTWLKNHYGSLDALAKTWYRYGYADWANVHPPANFNGYPESLDWLDFRVDDAFDLMKWRTDLVRRLDPTHKVIAHGVAGTLDTFPANTHNEWRSAELVDTWGLTWIAARKGNELWRQFQALDLVRGGSRGKPFWHAEAQAGPLWMQPQVLKRDREDGRIPDEKDVRLWNLISCAGGATGLMYPRWRPLLDGPLFGAFGAFAMDGSETPRSEMAGKVAKWANAHPEIWKARPVKGDIGIVFAPESEMFNYVQQGATDYYTQSVRGAYQGFFDNNIQADFVHIDDLKQYKAVYLPYPVMLKAASAKKVLEYVRDGGILISEGLPAYFGDHGKVGTKQPNYGLDEVFGARESYVEFTPDILDNLTLNVRGSEINGRYFLQAFQLAGGVAAGAYKDGKLAAVEHAFGKGKALLIGSFPGGGYYLHHSAGGKEFFAGLLDWAGLQQQVKTSATGAQARLHTDSTGGYLWVVNPERSERTIEVTVPDGYRGTEDVWGNQKITSDGRKIGVKVSDRDVAVIRLVRN